MESQDLRELARNEAGLDVAKTLGLLPMFLLIAVVVLRISWVLYRSTLGQKTRSTQQQRQRVYVGSRTRQMSDHEPAIYVSPANLPPPPKYEISAPPSYEEVMGVHYPTYPQAQPITQPLTHALAQTSAASNASDSTTTNTADTSPPHTVVTIPTEERQTSVTVRS